MPLEFKTVKHWVSPTRWVANISNLLLKYVGQKTILVFIVLELLAAILAGWFFYWHRAVAYLSLWGWRFKAFLVASGARISIAVFGFYAVWARRIQWTKIYYGLFAISGFLALLSVLPLQWMKCNCNNWTQCKALTAFRPKGTTLLNPHQHPNLEVLARKRKVPYAEPPADSDSAVIFTESLYEAKEAKKRLAMSSLGEFASRRLSDADTAAVSIDSFGGHGRLVKKRRRPAESLAPEHDVPPVLEAPRLHSKDWEPNAELPSALLQNPKDPHKKDKRRGHQDLAHTVEEHPLKFFNTTMVGIAWTSNEKPVCESRGMSAKHQEWLHKQFSKARRNDMSTVLDEYIVAKLFICAVDSACAGVSATLYKSPDPKAKPFYYHLCQHWQQLVPELDRPTAPEERKPVDSIFFLRNPIAIKKELEVTNSNPTKFYQRAFRRLDSTGGMKYLKKLQKTTCMCEESDGGCKTYTDSVGQEKFWCYIKEAQRDHCIEEGIQLFWDKKEERIWAFELCDKRGCECSNLGMLPENLEAPNVNKSILEGNKLNFGIECKQWTTDTPLPWCYIGLSSTCADRTRGSDLWASGDHPKITSLRLKMQYRSSLPCEEEEQHELRERTESRCMDRASVTEVFMLICVLLYLPMIVIIFKFLSNRCGDEFHLEEQFAVVLTTDEEESEDEFVPGQTKGEAGTKGAVDPQSAAAKDAAESAT